MSDQPPSPTLGPDDSREPLLARHQQQDEAPPPHANESSSLLGHQSSIGHYGVSSTDRQHSAADSLHEDSSKKPQRRWPSILAFTILVIVIIAILCLGFAAPAVLEEYAKEATHFEPTSLSIEKFTESGLQARVRGDLKIDGSRVHDKPVRDLGRAATWIAAAVETKETRVDVILPEYDNLLLGTAIVPPLLVQIRDGSLNNLDFLADLTAGDIDGLKKIGQDWIKGRIGRLSVKASAWVSLKSGIFSLGAQRLDQSIVFAGEDIPSMPGHTVTGLNFTDIQRSPHQRALAAQASIIVENNFPLDIVVPPLTFNILVPACSSDSPYIQVANATTESVEVKPKKDVTVDVHSVVQELPDSLTSTCPKVDHSPLDALVGGYIRGEATTLYIQGADEQPTDTPRWITEFLSGVRVPVEFRGKTLGNLIRNFSLEDVHFSLPDPFSGPDSPSSQPSVSATIKALINLPKEINFDLDINRVKAKSDIYYKDQKLGQLDTKEWHKADSERVPINGTNSSGLVVSAKIKDAPVNITNNDVLTDLIQTLIFGKEDTILDVKAAVDVEAKTVIGSVVAREIPAKGKVFVNPITKGNSSIKSFAPKIGSLQVLDTTQSSFRLGALANMTNPTKYSATIPYANITILNNGTELGSACVTKMTIVPGRNDLLPAQAIWNPEGEAAQAHGRELLSQYISGYNTTLTLRTHNMTFPHSPALGHALSRFTIDFPTPSLSAPKNSSDTPDDDDDTHGPNPPSYITNAIFRLLTSTASFTLNSPLTTSTIIINNLNATAYYNHTQPVGLILYDEPFPIPPGVSESPDLPVDWDASSVGYSAVKDAVGGRLKLDAKATVDIQVGNWQEKVWMIGRGIGAGIRLF